MSDSGRSITRFLDFIVHRPIATIVFSLIASGVFFLGLFNFGLNPSPRDYLGEGAPLVQDLIQLEEEYVEDMNVFVMFRPQSGSAFNRDTLAAVERFTEAAWQLPFMTRVDSPTNFQHSYAEGDDLIVESLVENAEQLSDADIAKIKDIAMREPALLGYLVSENGKALGLNISVNVDLGDHDSLLKISNALDEIKAEIHEEFPAVDIRVTGFVYMIAHWILSSDYDIQMVFIPALVVIMLGLLYFLGNLRAAIAVFLTGTISVLIALGLLGLVNIKLSPASLLGCLMILVLGLADGIHVAKGVRRLIGSNLSIAEAIKKSVVLNFTPIMLTSLTTAVGFLTFNFSGFEGVVVLGNFVAIGVIVAFILSMTLLPALLVFCNIKPHKNENNRASAKLAEFVIRYHKWLIGFTVPVILISIFCISLNQFDERVTRYLREGNPFTDDLLIIQDELTGAASMIYNFKSGEAGGVSSPEFMGKVEAFTQWARQQPEVRQVSSYTDTMKRLNKNLNTGNEEFYKLPDSKELAAQYLLLYEMSLPYGLDLTNQINLDKSNTRVVLVTNDMLIRDTTDLIKRNREWLQQHAADLVIEPNSNSVATLLMVEKSIAMLIGSGVLALIIIGIVLLFTFRSLVAGALCVLSVMSPILVTYGLWGLLVGRVGMPGALSICMVIGIAVDFSVHFVSKFVYGRRVLGESAVDSIRYAFTLVVGPILTSVAVLGAGFTMLILSPFEYNYVMGSITALCIFFSAFSALLLVPSILLVERFSVK